MPIIATTPRLLIRTFRPDEEAAYLALFADPRVNEHLPVRTPEENRNIFADILKEDSEGAVFSKWAIVNQADDDLIGMGLLRIYNGQTDKLEVGYCLHTKYWGRGIATEVVNTLLYYAANYPEIKSIVAVTTPGNSASQIVLQKAGLVKQGSIVRNNEELVFFQREL